MNEQNDILNIFGLTAKQRDILFSLERFLTEKDIENNPKNVIEKEHWLHHWCSLLCMGSGGTEAEAEAEAVSEKAVHLMNEADFRAAIQQEAEEHGQNLTWFYMIMMEATLFQAYTPLGEQKDADRSYKNLKYKPQQKYLEELAQQSGLMKPMYIQRFLKTYQDAYATISGKGLKVVIRILTVLLVSAAAAAAAGLMAGPIAVMLVGGLFPELHGAALVAACLAYLGGGALIVGGSGMAGGITVIVGGGALVGAATGGAGVAAADALAKKNPQYTLTQAARLEVVMREILLNAQQDVQTAQIVIERMKERIVNLKEEILDLETAEKANREELSAIKKHLEYIERAYKDMLKFKSSYGEGMSAEGNVTTK